MNSYNEYGYCTAENAPHFRYEGFYAGTSTRDSVTNGYGSIIPCGFSDLAHGLSMGHYPVDVCMVRVTRPNSEGYVRIVCEAGYTYNATKAAKIVLAQVVDSAPSVFGDTAFHVSEIDRFVEYDEPMMRLPLSPPMVGCSKRLASTAPLSLMMEVPCSSGLESCLMPFWPH